MTEDSPGYTGSVKKYHSHVEFLKIQEKKKKYQRQEFIEIKLRQECKIIKHSDNFNYRKY